ncbi:MAG: acyltransferase family protein [Bosea sp. (in: a-proteobacteria)]
MSQNQSSTRLQWADVAKGLSIALVVMMHSTLGVQEAMNAAGWLNPVVEFAKPFRIPAFFLIAGFFFAGMLGRSWRALIDRRVLHFVYFLLLWSGILFVLKGGFLGLTSPNAALNSLGLSLLEPNSALWFIHALIVFAVVARASAEMPAWLVVGGAALLHMLMPETGWTAIDEFAQRFVFFVAGCRMAQTVANLASEAAKKPRTSLLIVMATAISTALAVWPASLGIGGGISANIAIMSLVLGFTGGLSLIIVAVHLAASRIGPALAHLGRNSLTIYVAFTIPMATMRIVLIKCGLFTDPGIVSVIVWTFALLAPLLMALVARRFGASFLFDKPGWVRLGERRSVPRLRAAE